MPRRVRTDDDDVSLFPFLSIIACVIGVLTMMISTMALAQMDGEEIAVIEEWEETQQELEKTDTELSDLTAKITEQLGPDGAGVQQQLKERQNELDTLTREQQELQERLREYQQQEVIIPTIDESQRETIVAMEAELAALREELAQMELELEEKKVSKQSRVSVLPAGSGLRLTPHFVECAQGAVLLHTIDPPKLIRAANMVRDEDFLNILNRVSASTDATVIFLVRADGLSTYYAARKLCDDRSIRNGKLPVAGDGRVDLSRFAKKDKK